MRQVVADHLAAEVDVAEHEVGRHDAVVQDLLVVIDVVEELVDRRDPLLDPALDDPPVGGGQDARDEVERQDAIDRVALGIDREGDPEIVELALGKLGAPAQLAQAEPPMRSRIRAMPASDARSPLSISQ